MGEREQWRRTLLAAMANYIDAGSIVAGAVALPIWAKHFGFGDSFVSFLGAFSSNAIAAGLGALIGGRVCDLLGRKKIYQWDLLMYAFGTLWIVFATQEWMLLIGFFIVGLTVGADVPASWTLITETAPNEKRGRFAGLAQVLWYVGAIAPGAAPGDDGVVAVGEGAEAARHRSGDQAAAEPPPRRRAGVSDRDVRDLEPRRRHLRDLLPLHPRRRRLHERPRHARAAGDLVHLHGAGRRLRLHAADRPRQPPRAAGVEHGAAARGVRAVHVLRRHVPDLADQRRAVRRGRRDRPAVAVPAVEWRAVPDPAALDRPGLHVRGGADRARRVAAAAPQDLRLGLQHAVGDPVRAVAGERPGRHLLRARHDGARPRGDPGGADAAAALRPP